MRLYSGGVIHKLAILTSTHTTTLLYPILVEQMVGFYEKRPQGRADTGAMHAGNRQPANDSLHLIKWSRHLKEKASESATLASLG